MEGREDMDNEDEDEDDGMDNTTTDRDNCESDTPTIAVNLRTTIDVRSSPNSFAQTVVNMGKFSGELLVICDERLDATTNRWAFMRASRMKSRRRAYRTNTSRVM
jgi:hypothetical protein